MRLLSVCLGMRNAPHTITSSQDERQQQGDFFHQEV